MAQSSQRLIQCHIEVLPGRGAGTAEQTRHAERPRDAEPVRPVRRRRTRPAPAPG